MTKRSRSDTPKKMFELKGQPSEDNTHSPRLEEYLKEHDRYQDVLVNGHTSDPQRPHQIGQLVEDLGKVLGDAGRREKKLGGRFLVLSFCFILPLMMF